MFECRRDTGKKAYLIPPGGSNGIGMFGYVESFAEMEKQVGDMTINDYPR